MSRLDRLLRGIRFGKQNGIARAWNFCDLPSRVVSILYCVQGQRVALEVGADGQSEVTLVRRDVNVG